MNYNLTKIRIKSMNQETSNVESAPAVAAQRVARAPDWLLKREKITQRQWRQIKRRDLRNLISAFDEYRMGCAHCPGTNGAVGVIGKLLNELKESHSIKKWGR